MPDDFPIKILIKGIEHSFTISQARVIMRDLQVNIDMLRIKCPTCRCKILPNQTCSCCAEPYFEEEEEEPFI